MNPMDLSGRRILVTGASSGIGRSCALLIAALNGQVILSGRDSDRLKQTLDAMPRGDTHVVVPFDLSRVEGIPLWLKDMVSEFGPLDGIVHSAGVFGIQPLRMLKAEQIETVYQINVSAGIALVRGLAQRNVGASSGSSVVFLASVMGLVGQSGQVAYSASKGALIAATKSLAVELAPAGIRVNCVAPGVVETEMTTKLRSMLTEEQFARIKLAHPLGLGKPEDVSYAVAFLVAPAARWITGVTLVVDGGYTAL